MGTELPLFPVEASTLAPQVDHLFYFLMAVATFFTVGIFLTIFYFAIRYRRRSESELPAPVHGVISLEILWSVIPFGLTMVMFVWGASVFFHASRPPDDAQQIYVVGKRWMWKLQHMEGQREIDELHIPVGRPVKLTMTSEDVIHSFFVPAFRTKADVLPGRYTTTWFQPTKPGKYHIFCAQYCGTKHSAMIGWVYVMEPQAYQAWLSGGTTGSLASTGEKLFQDLACANCHHLNDQGRCPNLRNLFGSAVPLSDGRTVKADEAYIRESILNPSAKVVAGYQPIMPTFQGLVTEEGVLQLIEYIKSLTPKPMPAAPGAVKTAFPGKSPKL
ncbi:MAG TPA: cytochrome c oxidase subunit II [Bryobacteraceae bacterium]|nr:cytochrome c oxidase subunit II [Bryobacteraceae bacterium]